MRILRLLPVSAVLMAVLSGCGGNAPVQPEPEAAVSAAEALTSGAQPLASTSYKFSILVEDSTRISIDGKFDPATRSMMASIRALRRDDPSQRIESESIAIGTDLWARTAEGEIIPDEQKWVYTDLSDAPQLQTLTSDPSSIGTLASAVIDVEYGDNDRRLAGTVDLTQLERIEMFGDQVDLSGMTAMPFTARLDSRGRLAQFVVDLRPGSTNDKSRTITIELRSFGTTIAIEPPDLREHS